jgi:hypothetical protein
LSFSTGSEELGRGVKIPSSLCEDDVGCCEVEGSFVVVRSGSWPAEYTRITILVATATIRGKFKHFNAELRIVAV